MDTIATRPHLPGTNSTAGSSHTMYCGEMTLPSRTDATSDAATAATSTPATSPDPRRSARHIHSATAAMLRTISSVDSDANVSAHDPVRFSLP